MNTMRMRCSDCAGAGYKITYETVDYDETTCINTLQSKKNTCNNCNGQGYTEYAVFSVEEAQAILKYCGLDKR